MNRKLLALSVLAVCCVQAANAGSCGQQGVSVGYFSEATAEMISGSYSGPISSTPISTTTTPIPASCNIDGDFDISRGPTEVRADLSQPLYANETIRLILKLTSKGDDVAKCRTKQGQRTWSDFLWQIDNGDWTTYARKETNDTSLERGESNNEEVAFTIPDRPGSRICFRARWDTAEEIRETSENNQSRDECYTIRTPVQPPNFKILTLGIPEMANGIVKKDTRVHPWCTVINTGGPSPTGMRIAYYINWDKYRTDDGIDKEQLCAGCQQTERVNNDDIRLGDTGTRTYRCCADYQGAVVESDEGDNCAIITFVVK